jgi:hypothetical protein
VLRLPKRVYPRVPKSLPLLEQYPLYALSFDGVDDYVEVPHSAVLNVPEFTVAFWVNAAETPSVNKGLVMRGAGGYDYNYSFGIYTDRRVWFAVFNNVSNVTSYLNSDAALSLNTWYFIAGVFKQPSQQLYVNTSVKSATFNYPVSQGSWSTLIATSPARIYFFRGLIGLVYVYNRALSLAEIQRNIRNPLNPVRDGLVLWLPMVEGSGTTVRDFSGYGNNGTLYNGVGWRELAKWELPAAAGL